MFPWFAEPADAVFVLDNSGPVPVITANKHHGKWNRAAPGRLPSHFATTVRVRKKA
jgi:hypothetical protein